MKKLVLLFLFVFIFSFEEIEAAPVNLDDSTDDYSNLYNVNSNDLNLLFNSSSLGVFGSNDYKKGLLDEYPDLVTHNFPLEFIDNSLQSYFSTKNKTYELNLSKPLRFTGLYTKTLSNNPHNSVIFYFYDSSDFLIATKSYIFDKNPYEIYDDFSFNNVKKVVMSFSHLDYYKSVVEVDFFVDPISLYSSVSDIKTTSLNYNSAVLNWKNPIDLDFVENVIYLDDVEIFRGNMQNFNLKDLVELTNYKFTVLSNYSNGISVSKDFYFMTPVQPDKPPNDISNLILVSGIDSVSLSFNASTTQNVFYRIYRNNVLIKDNFKNSVYVDTGLEENTNYVYKVVTVSDYGLTSIGVNKSIKTLSSKDVIPPEDVSNLLVVEDYAQTSMYMGSLGIKQINALLTYDLPPDDDFSHVEIFKNDKLLSNSVFSNKYLDLNIGEKKTYKYTVKSVDTNGNKSKGVSVTLNTTFISDNVAPAAPTGLNVSKSNGGGKLSWFKNFESDLDGYNVYVDGVKYNTALIKNLSQTLKGLENGEVYQLTVTAVDWSGNESVHSAVIELIPDKNASVDVNLSENYNLLDVADGTASWFGALWWIVAFIVGMTLAVLLGRRIKELFVGS